MVNVLDWPDPPKNENRLFRIVTTCLLTTHPHFYDAFIYKEKEVRNEIKSSVIPNEGMRS